MLISRLYVYYIAYETSAHPTPVNH